MRRPPRATSTLLVVQQVASGEAAAATTRSMRATIARFSAGEYDPDMTRVIFDDLEEARRDLDAIRQAGLYGTADDQRVPR